MTTNVKLTACVCLSLLGLAMSEYTAAGGGGGGGLDTGYGVPSSGAGDYGGYHQNQHQEEHYEAKPYEFGYAVKDYHTGTDFGQQETSDGHNVKGQYRVLLPDGRLQIVTYTADWKTGFHADVKYEGEAHYPTPQGGYPSSGYPQGAGNTYSTINDGGGYGQEHAPTPGYDHQGYAR